MTVDLASRVARVQQAMAAAGVDGLVVTPGADLRYLTGYDAKPLERLTALVLPSAGDPVLVVPELEHAEAARTPAALAGMEIVTHGESDDAIALAASTAGEIGKLAVDDHMWATRVLGLAAAMPGSEVVPALTLLSDPRMIKGSDEVASLRRAAQAIDRVHARMGEFLRVGRTERDVGADLADAIIAEGHATVDFIIVGSGPNGASPHHGISDRAIEAGDTVVVDIGGSLADGYSSDCTRTYAVGGEPEAAILDYYGVLLEAQRAQCDAAVPGITAEALDRVGRQIISDGGFGEAFLHRTGHGIGLDTHEEPYVVTGNAQELVAGMAFSIEPGIYLAGQHGARIEDIVVMGTEGAERLNTQPRELVVLGG